MAPPPNRVAFSPVDTAWLRMDRPTNTMMITGVMMFEKPIDLAQLKQTLIANMLQYDRFRQRVRESPFRMTLPHWEDDPHFDINAHVHRVALPAPGDVTALQELVSDLMSTPLNYNRPLWKFHVVDNFGEGGALICRLHHCIADGVALVQVLLSMTDEAPETVQAIQPKRLARERLAQAAVSPGWSGVSGIHKLAGAAVEEGWKTLRRPGHAVELAKEGQELAGHLVRQGADVVAATGKLLLTLPDRKTIFRGSCGVVKRAAWSEPFPVQEVKAIGKRLGGTINDVLLAAVSGALRRYMEDIGQPTEGVQMNAMVPVNLRPPHEEGKLGNRFGLVILTLPVGTPDPIERLVIMKKRMNDIKNSPEALVAFTILNALGLVPIELERFAVDFFATKTSAVMTNVIGPKQPLYLAGNRMTDLMFWVPVSSNTGMGISIMSYAGRVMVGIMTDACMVSDPMTIAENFNVELREMAAWLAPEHAGAAETQAEAETPAGEEPYDAFADTLPEGLTMQVDISGKDAEEELPEENTLPEEGVKVLKEGTVTAPEAGHDGKASRKPGKLNSAAEVTEEAPGETVAE